MNRLLILGTVCFLIAADDCKDDAAKKVLEKMQGNWTVEKAELPGIPVADFAGQKLTIKGAEIEFLATPMKKGEIKIDPSKKPGHIDLIPGKDAPKDAPTIPGIYELDGDTLKIGIPVGKGSAKIDPKTKKTIEQKFEPVKRPTGFDDKEIMVLTLKRTAK